MKAIALCLSLTALVSAPALAQTEIVNQAAAAKIGGVPQFMVRWLAFGSIASIISGSCSVPAR
jgi:hypothetical protein